MQQTSIIRLSLLFAVFSGLWHLVWVVLINIDTASPVVDAVLWLHFFKLPLYIEPPTLSRAAFLIALTSLAGAGFGFVLAVLWNVPAAWVQRHAGPSRG